MRTTRLNRGMEMCMAMSSSATLEDAHLCWRAQERVLGANREKALGIAKSLGNPRGPVVKLLAAPLEAMVGMAKAAGRQAFPGHVVVAIGRGQHNRPRPGQLEQDA